MAVPHRRLRALAAHLACPAAGPTVLTSRDRDPKQTGGGGISASALLSTGMTDEQRFFFDLKCVTPPVRCWAVRAPHAARRCRGWIVLPAVLSRAEIIAEVDTEGYNIWDSSKALDTIDHPAVTPILADLLSEPSFVGEGARPQPGSPNTIRRPL